MKRWIYLRFWQTSGTGKTKHSQQRTKIIYTQILLSSSSYAPWYEQGIVFIVCKVHLFEGIVDEEENGSLSQEYMEVNFNSQNAVRQYLNLTNGVYLNEVMRIM